MDEKKEESNIKKIFVLFVGIFLIGTLVIYWFFPFNEMGFNFGGNSNFSLNVSEGDMQFYPNMRFPSKKISYSISENCSLQKKNDMKWAFDIIENETILDFYPLKDGLIKVFCDSKNKFEGGLFVAGEGGPVNVTIGKNFKVIHEGEILLIKASTCERPNVAIHELLHVLGFDHSDNPNNIMYPISKCKQTIGEDIINLINDLYSIPSYADLEFENANVNLKGRMIDIDYSVRNEGLKDSESFSVTIYINNKKIKELQSEGLKVGYGERVRLSNYAISQIKINEIKFKINNNFNELNKTNNEIILKMVENS